MSDYDGTERRDCIPSNQYVSVCKKEFKELRKRQKKYGRAIKELTGIVKNGHTTAIKHMLKQNKWIMVMISSVFFVLLAGMLTVILRFGGAT